MSSSDNEEEEVQCLDDGSSSFGDTNIGDDDVDVDMVLGHDGDISIWINYLDWRYIPFVFWCFGMNVLYLDHAWAHEHLLMMFLGCNLLCLGYKLAH